MCVCVCVSSFSFIISPFFVFFIIIIIITSFLPVRAPIIFPLHFNGSHFQSGLSNGSLLVFSMTPTPSYERELPGAAAPVTEVAADRGAQVIILEMYCSCMKPLSTTRALMNGHMHECIYIYIRIRIRTCIHLYAFFSISIFSLIQ